MKKYQIGHTAESIRPIRVIGPVEAPTAEEIKREIEEYDIDPDTAEWACEFWDGNNCRNDDYEILEGTLVELLERGKDFIRFAGDRAGHNAWKKEVGRKIIEAVEIAM